MSTRSVIGRVGTNEEEFSGVYHHWDGMPTSLGKALYELLGGHFAGDLRKMLRVLIDEHKGWSTIVGKNFRLKPGFSNDSKSENPACYCHGDRHEKNPPYTHKDLKGGTDIEWLYIFDEARNHMHVRDVRRDSEHIVELSEAEPNWTTIECGENYERCTHYAWAHGLLPRTSNLSTQTWLGNRPLDFHDVIAFIVDGKRYASTGCGGNSDYFNRSGMRTERYPHNCWISTVKARNGNHTDVPVAKIDGEKYVSLPGVVWVMPATRSNPTETLVSA
ncbi:MAG: hypothetical protein ACRDHZ_03900 [Ktedonobacteraceae bacterium]